MIDESRNRSISPELLQKMRGDWDARARQAARYYVATGERTWTDEEFFRSGETHVREQILNDMTNICGGCAPASMRVLEIGCGAGRVTRALARVFGSVDAVDVSGEMITRARDAIGNEPNVRFHQNNGMDLSMLGAAEFDFAFSSIVFQHIPARAVIENYIRETWRVLRPGKLFKFQVQGVPTASRRDDTWVGIGLTEADMAGIAERTGFEMRFSHGAQTQDFWLWFFKRDSPR